MARSALLMQNVGVLGENVHVEQVGFERLYFKPFAVVFIIFL